MRKWSIYKALFFVIFLVVILFAVVVMTTEGKVDVRGNYYKLRHLFVDSMTRRLELEYPLPASFSNQGSAKATCLYVLGGNQDSLSHRFRKASSLYNQGLSRKILILSKPGITEFSPDLERNLTNDEWAIRELEIFHVKKEDIEPVSVKVGFWGTLSEARDLTDIVRKKGCNRLILVTSDYHTRRAFIAFLRYSTNDSPTVYVYGAEDTTGFLGILAEYVKLLLYDHFALPLNRL